MKLYCIMESVELITYLKYYFIMLVKIIIMTSKGEHVPGGNTIRFCIVVAISCRIYYECLVFTGDNVVITWYRVMASVSSTKERRWNTPAQTYTETQSTNSGCVFCIALYRMRENMHTHTARMCAHTHTYTYRCTYTHTHTYTTHISNIY